MAFVETQTKIKKTIIDRFESNCKEILLFIRNKRLYLRTISELNSLSNRELSDLGLSRSMIKTIAYNAVYQGQDVRGKL